MHLGREWRLRPTHRSASNPSPWPASMTALQQAVSQRATRPLCRACRGASGEASARRLGPAPHRTSRLEQSSSWAEGATNTEGGSAASANAPVNAHIAGVHPRGSTSAREDCMRSHRERDMMMACAVMPRHRGARALQLFSELGRPHTVWTFKRPHRGKETARAATELA